MAYDTSKLTTLKHLASLAEKTKTELDKKADKATTLSGYGITDAYTKTEADSAITAAIKNKADNATTLSGYGITDAYTKTQVDSKISAVYKPAGSVAFASLPTAEESLLGNVYNVTDAFTTTAAFVEGTGKTYPAGTNVVVVSTGTSTYGYDVLAGFVDLSGYVTKETGKGLSTNDYTADEKTKLAGIAEGATKTEASTTNGNVKINGTETTVYKHPTATAKAAAFVKVGNDDSGHVVLGPAVAKTDITALGIPAQDTTYTAATSSADGLMSAEDKAKLDGMEIATDDEVAEMLSEKFSA